MTGWRRIGDGAVEVVLLALLLLAPLPYGAVEPWAQSAIQAVSAVLVAGWLTRAAVAGRLTLRLSPLLGPGLAMAALLVLQVARPSGSVFPRATAEGARLYFAYLGLLVVLGGHLTTRARLVRMSAALVAGSVGLAILGFLNLMAGDRPVLWLPKAYDRLTGTFVNPNHQALAFAIGLFLAVGLLLRPSGRDGLPGSGRPTPAGPGGAVASPAARVLLIGAILLLGAALVGTASRAGLVSVLAGIGAVIGLSVTDRMRARVWLAVVAVAVTCAGYAAWIGLDLLADRFAGLAREPFGDLRYAVWTATLRMVGEAPWLGVGLGAFGDAFPRFRPAEVPGDRIVTHAHNDYLEVLAETGLVGMLVLGWAVVALAVFVVGRWRARRDPFVRGMVMGGLGGAVAVAVHSATDFGLRMPANALLVVALASLLPATVTLRRHRDGERVDLREWRRDLGRGGRAVLMASGVVILLVTGSVVGPAAVADVHLQRALRTTGAAERSAGALTLTGMRSAARELEAARRWEPGNPRVLAVEAGLHAEFARRAWFYGVDPDGRWVPPAVEARLKASQAEFAIALSACQAGLVARPRSAELRDQLGWLLADLELIRRSVAETALAGQVDARLGSLVGSPRSVLPDALAELEHALAADPRNARRHRSLALLALTRLEGGADRRRLAVEHYRQALSLDAGLLSLVAQDIAARERGSEFLREAAPRQFASLLAVGRLLEARRDLPGAAEAYEDARQLAVEPAQRFEAQLALAGVLLRSGDPARALAYAREVLVAAPKDPETFAVLGEIYLKLGQGEEAEAALATAVSLGAGLGSQAVAGYRARLAAVVAGRGDLARAAALWRQVIEASPNDGWSRLELGRLLVRQGDASGALREYQTARLVAGRDGELQGAVGDALAAAGHLREGIASYEAAVRLHPGDALAHVRLGELYAQAGWPERAAEQYRLVLGRQPDHAAARRALDAVAPTAPSRGTR